jgi:hypothetical protein
MNMDNPDFCVIAMEQPEFFEFCGCGGGATESDG